MLLFKSDTVLSELADESNNMALSYKERDKAWDKVIERMKSNPEEGIFLNEPTFLLR